MRASLSEIRSAKAALNQMLRTAAIELQRHGITVNAVAPLARTRLTEADPALDTEAALGPEHVAPATLFLACDLSTRLSGCVLAVGGGRLSTFRMVESRGQFEGEREAWTPEQIADHWEGIAK